MMNVLVGGDRVTAKRHIAEPPALLTHGYVEHIMTTPSKLEGKVFGLLTVEKRIGSNDHGQSIWSCKCSCGGSAVTTSARLNNGAKRSCGCIKKERKRGGGPKAKPCGPCSVDGCQSLRSSPGVKYCSKHAARISRAGRLTIIRRENGTGNINAGGYVDVRIKGRRTYEHILVAERALGRRLPKGAVVHHVNENRSDNAPTNLVICPNEAYHRLLHRRMKVSRNV